MSDTACPDKTDLLDALALVRQLLRLAADEFTAGRLQAGRECMDAALALLAEGSR